MERRDFLKTAGLATAGFALGGTAAGAGNERPNVLIILVDQLRQPRFTPLCRTPNLDRLAGQGVSFTNSFVAAVACSPSRACLLTGTYTIQNELYHNVDLLFRHQRNLDPAIPTMGHIWRRAGYKTPYHGKWHLTRVRDLPRKNLLDEYGFDDWSRPDASGGGGAYCGALQDPLYTRRTVDWLRDPAHQRDPWFMVCSLVNPHDIVEFPGSYPQRMLRPIKTEEPPPNYVDDLSSKPGVQREWRKSYGRLFGHVNVESPDAWRRYLDYYIHCIEHVDANIGKALDALEASGQRDNTIIVFTSDHGEMAGSHQLRAKGPFAYEEILNIPTIFSWPGRLPQGVTTDAMTSNVDLLPTLAALTGVGNLPYLAGQDISSVLHDPASKGPRDHVIYHMNASPVPSPADRLYQSPTHVHAIRERDWKYACYLNPATGDAEYELYNLKDDPLEMDNRANDAEYANRKKEMHDRLMEQEEMLVDNYKQA